MRGLRNSDWTWQIHVLHQVMFSDANHSAMQPPPAKQKQKAGTGCWFFLACELLLQQ